MLAQFLWHADPVHTLVGLIVFLIVVGILLRLLGFWGAPGPEPATGYWANYGTHSLVGLLVFIVVLVVLFKFVFAFI
jgi:hypothetical protein